MAEFNPVITMSTTEEPRLPRHVAIVMDGNGRWAKYHGLPRHAGHRAGIKAVRATVEACAREGIDYLTLFAFSSENWRRPQQEVGMLMQLFLTSLRTEVKRLHRNNIRLRLIGDHAAFGRRLQERIVEAETLTAGNTGLNLIIAANYGGRWDINQAARRLARYVERNELGVDEITPERFERELSLAGVPDPDLFIRTGGEQRISNFLLWQMAYTELYFTDVLWPEFDHKAFKAALTDFARRQRRFGQTGEQVERRQGA